LAPLVGHSFTSHDIRSFGTSYRTTKYQTTSTGSYKEPALPKIDNEKAETAGNVISKNDKLATYCKKVGITTSKYLGITALSGAIAPITMLGLGGLVGGVLSPDLAVPIMGFAWFGAAGTSFYGAYKLGTVEPIYDSKGSMTNEDERKRYANMVHIGMGVTISPSLIIFANVIPAATVLTTALVAGPIGASLMLPKGQLLGWGPGLMIGLFGLIGAGIGGIWFPILHNVSVYGGVGLFSLIAMHDTHKMIDDFENGKEDHIGHATDFSLTFINIFVRLLEILGRLNGNSND
jgi:hypothetical protein